MILKVNAIFTEDGPISPVLKKEQPKNKWDDEDIDDDDVKESWEDEEETALVMLITCLYFVLSRIEIMDVENIYFRSWCWMFKHYFHSFNFSCVREINVQFLICHYIPWICFLHLVCGIVICYLFFSNKIKDKPNKTRVWLWSALNLIV